MDVVTRREDPRSPAGAAESQKGPRVPERLWGLAGSYIPEPELNQWLEAGHLSFLAALASALITEHPECHWKLKLCLLLVSTFPPLSYVSCVRSYCIRTGVSGLKKSKLNWERILTTFSVLVTMRFNCSVASICSSERSQAP